MNEKPLERLNYYNGQRLQAADLRLEQDYHIRVRRWLNRSLYSAGIAEGLAVYAIKDQPRVRVTPGLAIDHLGREIILLEEAVIDVVDGHHGGGPYLTISYREEVLRADRRELRREQPLRRSPRLGRSRAHPRRARVRAAHPGSQRSERPHPSRGAQARAEVRQIDKSTPACGAT